MTFIKLTEVTSQNINALEQWFPNVLCGAKGICQLVYIGVKTSLKFTGFLN